MADYMTVLDSSKHVRTVHRIRVSTGYGDVQLEAVGPMAESALWAVCQAVRGHEALQTLAEEIAKRPRDALVHKARAALKVSEAQ